MRNDVKLGLAIGGVLLAVMIVYVLVVPGGSKPADQVSTTQQPGEGSGVTLEPVPDESAAIPAPPPQAPDAEFTPPAPTNESESASAEPKSSGREIDWNRLLNEQPVLMMDTPVPTEGADRADSTVVSDEAAAAEQSTEAAKGQADAAPSEAVAPTELAADENAESDEAVASTETVAEPDVPEPAPQPLSLPPTPPSGVARTHTIRAGETLSSISVVAYGSANHYPAIIRANPGIDPNRLKVGMTINLPAIDTAAEAQSASARIAPAVDLTRQYRVVAGDSLHKISFKLYGKYDRADKIYELNKKSIGDDPARIKVGQILDLPEPPTMTASSQ